MLYRTVLRRLFFLLSPERAHGIVLFFLRLWVCLRGRVSRDGEEGCDLLGLRFPRRVGLAAGFDKGCHLGDRVDALGFGFVEVGTVTPVGQPGNARPRLFRLPADGALINRMGFNSEGVEVVSRRLRGRSGRGGVPVGVSLGKNTQTELSHASSDYRACLARLGGDADFAVVNVSCPNVSDLSCLQGVDSVRELVRELVSARTELGYRLPLLVKVGPYQSESSLRSLARGALAGGADGFVACNTWPGREGLRTSPARLSAIGSGGLSGRPLLEESLRTVGLLREEVGLGVPIIGVGGISSGADALRMLQAGADLVEVFTGYIYEGPFLTSRISRYLAAHKEEIPRWNKS